jgi:hypothetical protein
MTVWSIAQACSDVAVVEVPHGADVATWLAERGCDEPCFILHAGMIVLRDPWANVPPDVDLSAFTSGTCSALMYAAPGCQHPDYPMLGVDVTRDNHSDRLMFVTPGQMSGRTMKMPTRMRYGPDPVVRHINEAFRQTEFHRESLESCVLDFGDEATNPAISTTECFAYPFDVYARVADEVREHLPPALYDTIHANARRGAFSYAMAGDLIH